MPRSVEFNWDEGDHHFDVAAESQPLPSAKATASSQPGRVKAPRAPRTRPRTSNLVLLLVGILLGVVAGFVILSVQGQSSARSDLAPTIALQYQAQANNDEDLYGSLIDPEDGGWKQAANSILPRVALLADASSKAPRVRSVSLQGNNAEVEVDISYEGNTYRRVERLRLVDDQWRLARFAMGDWGAVESQQGRHVTLHYRHRDAFLADALPQIDAIAQSFCDRYAIPRPCRVDLTVEPDPNLLPFLPGEGADSSPGVARYLLGDQGHTGLITINGDGEETTDPAFQKLLLEVLPAGADPSSLTIASAVGPEDAAIAHERLYGRTIPVKIISPRMAGVDGDKPHPLWQLALHEAIGDAVMRRALGPVTADEDTANAVWALARGDAALWAERFSGAQLPGSLPDPSVLNPAAIGAALASGDDTARNAAGNGRGLSISDTARLPRSS